MSDAAKGYLTEPLSLRRLRYICRWARKDEHRRTGIDRRPECLTVHLNPDIAIDAMALPNFTPRRLYLARQPLSEHEIGSVEMFRFVTTPALPERAWAVQMEAAS